MGKSFTSEVADVVSEVEGDEYIYDFKLDDRVVRYRKPRSGEAMMMVIVSSKHTPLVDKLAGVVDLFATVIHPANKDWVIHKIYDGSIGPKVLFGEDGDDGVLADMLEEWSARPTKASSDS